MKLIKLTDDHYIVVDENIQPVNGLYYDAFVKAIKNTSGAEYAECSHCWQITHSTLPTESDARLMYYFYNNIKPLSPLDVKELINVVDVEKKATDYSKTNSKIESTGAEEFGRYWGFKEGYNQALEDNKDKKYTETDIKNAIIRAYSMMGNRIDVGYFNEVIKSLQPETEWDVEFLDNKIKLKQ